MVPCILRGSVATDEKEFPPRIRFDVSRLVAPTILAGLLLTVYADVLLTSPMPVISAEGRDGHRYFSVSRAFGFGEMSRGNLPLWNPHVFAGVPYLPGIQSALLYPVNVIYLLLPLPMAMNADILFHIWLLGLGMYFWVRGHGVERAPSILSGTISMFAAPYFLHAWSGHLTMIAAYAWAPFFFRAIDRTLERPTLRETALGIVAVTMMVLAGYPQAAYSCALVAAIYLAVQLPTLRVAPIAKLSALAAIAIAPLCLTAAQWAPTAEFANESVRVAGVDQADSFEYSLLPRHLIQALAPGFFGGTSDETYWGGGFRLETGVFLGRIVLLLAMAGILFRTRARWPAIAVMIVCGSIALGPHTLAAPFFHDWVPGFDRFRAPGRYWMFVGWFAALLTGIALQRLQNRSSGQRWLSYSALAVTVSTWMAYAITVFAARNSSPESWWTSFVDASRSLNEELRPTLEQALDLASQSAPNGLLSTALVLTVFTAMCWAPVNTRWRTLGIVTLGCLEMTVFARAHRQVFDAALLAPQTVVGYEESREDESRVLNLANDNEAMRAGAFDVSGYEPGMLYRFDRFLSHLNAGLFNRNADGSIHGNVIAALLRCGTLIDSNGERMPSTGEILPRFLFVTNFEVIPDENAMLERLFDPTFNPSTTILLHDNPGFVPETTGSPASINVLETSTDETSLEIEVPRAGLLLCTDAYSEGWRAEPLQGSIQQRYDVMPAQYALRAIPLQPGVHRLEMFYEPASYTVGLWVSSLSALALNMLLIGLIYRHFRFS